MEFDNSSRRSSKPKFYGRKKIKFIIQSHYIVYNNIRIYIYSAMEEVSEQFMVEFYTDREKNTNELNDVTM